MLFSYKWLKEYFVDDLPNPEKLVDLLTQYSFEIEGLSEKNNDHIIDIDVLPNRAHDALCHYGMAREISTITGVPLKDLNLSENKISFAKGDIKVKVEGDFCNRYIAREIKNIKVSESPKELRDKLEAIDQRSINNIVDITNLVMFEFNQPMHAFDLEKLDGNINVRFAKDGEHITTLDNQEVDLNKNHPTISDGSSVLAVAGIKGGKKAEVDLGTKSIVLESANFDSVLVRKTSQNINVKTESSKRFENGITPELAHKAMARATELILKYAATDKTIVSESYDHYPNPVEKRSVKVHVEKVNSLLGTKLSIKEISEILNKLMFEHQSSEDSLEVEIPHERMDLLVEADLIEEVGRIYGYNNIPDQDVIDLDFEPQINIKYFVDSLIRKTMTGIGFSEVITYSFVKEGVLFPEKPIADDKKYLRSSIKEGMMNSLDFNSRNADWLGFDHVMMFEIGKVFDGEKNNYYEKNMLAIGVVNKKGVKKPKAGTLIKESLVELSKVLGVDINVKINEEQDIFVEINLDDIYEQIDVNKLESQNYSTFSKEKNTTYKEISTYPFVLRDIAVWLPNETDPEELVSIIKDNSTGLLVKDPKQFDVYEKDNKTSYAYRLVFQSYEKTLTDEEVNNVMDKINKEVEAKGWKIR